MARSGLTVAVPLETGADDLLADEEQTRPRTLPSGIDHAWPWGSPPAAEIANRDDGVPSRPAAGAVKPRQHSGLA